MLLADILISFLTLHDNSVGVRNLQQMTLLWRLQKVVLCLTQEIPLCCI